jgi:hypothetical protein
LDLLKWPFNEPEIQKPWAVIEREQSLHSMALDNNSRKLVVEI